MPPLGPHRPPAHPLCKRGRLQGLERAPGVTRQPGPGNTGSPAQGGRGAEPVRAFGKPAAIPPSHRALPSPPTGTRGGSHLRLAWPQRDRQWWVVGWGLSPPAKAANASGQGDRVSDA